MAKGGAMVICYTAVGDYLLPNIAYCDDTLYFGRYSRLWQKFLKENHGGIYSEMLLAVHFGNISQRLRFPVKHVWNE